MIIRKLNIDEEPPMDLLLLADPSRILVEEYIQRGVCFVAESDGQIIGIYVLLPTRPETVELVNIAVIEDQHGKGLGKQLIMNAMEV
ncbi:GNAT family N-acetyltransferase, partial [Robertmurraya sp.]|uniref:GNAT family N-acetyltransferase n=1 Tax=Robertmurraya sp. TaxID=2837525 RepID=UPI0037041930